jgi:nucleolar protein 56
MQVKTWFGIFTLDDDRIMGAELFRKDLEAIANLLVKEPLLLRGRIAGSDIRDLAVEYGFVSSREEYDSLLHELNIRLVKEQISQAVTQDRQIIAAVEAIDDINDTANILAERLREWYLMFNETGLQGGELAKHIIKSEEPELKTMQGLAGSLIGLYEARLSIEEYLKDGMLQLAPNLTNIAGYILGARLLSIAGSLEKLASMPSSTVQVIGANNALFKHLKGKAPSPKHGLIFRHPLINTAPKKLRGKIARAVASKISLAARYDYYSGELKESLLEELEVKVSGIKKRHAGKNHKKS